ncbi:MAG: hypothetical protein M3345_06160 [Actinomycetota bacterium]|nr:hypothetical protein [Actinomycetota bacterium]
MKRLLLLFMVLGLIAGSVATAEAEKRKKPPRVERTVEVTYDAPFVPMTVCGEWSGLSWGCVDVPTRKTEASFTAKVTDAHGLPVAVNVYSSNEYGTFGHYRTFCGETTEAWAIQPGVTSLTLVVGPHWPYPPTPDCPTSGMATTGTISVTLSNINVEPEPEPVEPEPVRSGSILSGTGWLLDSQLGGCQMSPECAAWMHADCEQALAEREPGVTASIVNVDDLADGPPIKRVFRSGVGEPGGLPWGGVQLQFWSRDCAELREARWRAQDCGRDPYCPTHRLRIPPDAKWMTVTGYQDNVNLAWTLT